MAQIQFEKEYQTENIRGLSIKNPNGRIEIRGWKKPSIKIEASISVAGTTVSRDVYPKIIEDGDTLIVKCSHGRPAFAEDLDLHGIMENVYEIGDEVRHSVEGVLSEFIHIAPEPPEPPEPPEDPGKGDRESRFQHFEVNLGALDELPEKIKEIKKVITEKIRNTDNYKTENAGIHDLKTDLRIFAPSDLTVVAKGMNGVIICEEYLGDITLKATNGQIRLRDVRGEVYVRSMNGLISIESCDTTSLNAKTMNGPIKASFRNVSGEVSLKTLNGPIRAVFPGDSDISMEIRAVSSPVKVASGFQTDLKSQRRFSGKLGKGTHSVFIKSVSGPVTVVTSGDVPPVSGTETVVQKKSQPLEVSQDEGTLSLIDRMVKNGKITEEEAEKLRSVV